MTTLLEDLKAVRDRVVGNARTTSSAASDRLNERSMDAIGRLTLRQLSDPEGARLHDELLDEASSLARNARVQDARDLLDRADPEVREDSFAVLNNLVCNVAIELANLDPDPIDGLEAAISLINAYASPDVLGDMEAVLYLPAVNAALHFESLGDVASMNKVMTSYIPPAYRGQNTDLMDYGVLDTAIARATENREQALGLVNTYASDFRKSVMLREVEAVTIGGSRSRSNAPRDNVPSSDELEILFNGGETDVDRYTQILMGATSGNRRILAPSSQAPQRSRETLLAVDIALNEPGGGLENARTTARDHQVPDPTLYLKALLQAIDAPDLGADLR